MGMRQPASPSPTPAYGLPEGAVASRHSGAPSGLLPLLLLCVALAAAAVWYVALPAFQKTPGATRSCEVIVLSSGTTKCVSERSLERRHAPRAKTGHAAR
jgi:hypothetical protein